MKEYFDQAPSYVPYIVGYIFSLFVGQYFIKKTMIELKKEIKQYLSHEKDKNIGEAYSWYASKVGYIDIILYVTFLLFGHPEFIAAWLAFKIVGRWESTKLEAKEREEFFKSRPLLQTQQFILNNAEYNLFTIGNALSIIYALAGWKIIGWITRNKIDRAFLLGTVIIVGSEIFYRSAKEQTKKLNKLFSNPAK
jgi:hypothetical protein